MSGEALRRRVQAVAPPGELDAERRAWAVVRAAWEEREPVPRRRRLRPRVLVPALAAAVVLAVAVTPAGPAVVHAFRDAVVVKEEPALTSLPSPGGRLLVVAGDGLWVVRADGSKRRLGDYVDGDWSPHGLFVGEPDRRQDYALEAGSGDVRWSGLAPASADPRWMPGTGFRVAYRSGRALRIVAGDGTGDRLLDARVGPAAPAWRPESPSVLAYADADGSLRLLDVDSGRTIWRTPAGPRPVALAWSSDGSRLAVASARRVRILGTQGRTRRIVSVPRDRRVAEIAFGAQRLAVIVRGAGASEVIVVGGNGRRVLTRSPGVLEGLAWSPDRRRLLVGWPTGDGWLFLPVGGGSPLVVTDLAGDFGGDFPRVLGWKGD